MGGNQKTGVIKKTAGNYVANLLGINLETETEVTVYRYNKPTEDCVLQPNHVAISLSSKREKFFGIPENAVNWQ